MFWYQIELEVDMFWMGKTEKVLLMGDISTDIWRIRSNQFHGDEGRSIRGRGSCISKGWETENSLAYLQKLKKDKCGEHMKTQERRTQDGVER